MKTFYIAGPMRGYPRFNFDAFYDAEESINRLGYKTINPARLDRENGFDPDKDEVTKEFLDEAMKRDIDAIMRCDGVVLLPGWEKSTGATAEMHLAKWRHIDILLWPGLRRLDEENILDEAKRITSGDRQAQYGPPEQDFARTAAMWRALFGWVVTPKQVAMAMICLKLSRETHQKKRDNAVDIAGYAYCLSKCQ